MLAFLDECGDAGRRLERGSSRYFIVAVVTFEDLEEAQACDDAISALRTDLRLPAAFEFHFSQNSRRVREEFTRAVGAFGFSHHVFALNKDPGRLTGEGFNYKESLYKWCARMTFENAKPYLHEATVVIDKSGDRHFRDELASYLRRRINDREGPRHIRKVKMQRSDGNNLLQLADYVAGAAGRRLNGKRDGDRLYEQLRTHEITWRVWP